MPFLRLHLCAIAAVCLVACGGFDQRNLPGFDAGIPADGGDTQDDIDPFDRFDAGRDAGGDRRDAGRDAGPMPRDASVPDAAPQPGDAAVPDAAEPDPVCLDGYAYVPARRACVAIDACATDNGGCGDPAFTRCTNVPGAAPACVDIDECAATDDPCGGYECHDQIAQPPLCEQTCPPDSNDVRGDGSLCVARVRAFEQNCALLTGGELRCYRGFAPAFASQSDLVQIDSSYDLTCGLHGDGHMSCTGYRATNLTTTEVSGLRQIAISYPFACALHTDDALECWPPGPYPVPAPEGEAARFAQIDAGLYIACGVRRDGTLQCWGNGYYGEALINADGGTDYVQVSIGDLHTCALRRGGSIKCWTSYATLLDDRVTGPNADVRTDYVQVSAGALHTCGLHADGTLTCWGSPRADEISGPNTDAHPPFVRIATQGVGTCGFTADARWRCWGVDDQGRARLEPVAMPRAVRFDNSGCLVREDGSLYCGPDAAYNGVASAGDAALRALHADGGKNFVASALGYYGACALGTDARMYCWPDRYSYDSQETFDTMLADPRNHDFVDIGAGYSNWCGRHVDGSVDCFQLPYVGTGEPYADAVADGGPFIDFQAHPDSDHTCAIRTGGELVCFAPDATAAWVAGPNAATSDDFVQLALGPSTTCALREDGTHRCWPDDGTAAVLATEPRQEFVRISTSGTHTCGVRADGSLLCRGDNSSGQVSGPNQSREAAIVDVRTSWGSTCALRADGSVRCWGAIPSDTRALVIASRQAD